jgi:uncharacterized membrane protein YsdA (DUF1294 family)
LLILLPSYALSGLKDRIDWRFLVGVPTLVSLLTYFFYRSDKRRAEDGDWRVPESSLHLLELVGGWPGAFLAQRTLRHKTAKTSFQLIFWSIVILYQLAALDAISHGPASSFILHALGATSG